MDRVDRSNAKCSWILATVCWNTYVCTCMYALEYCVVVFNVHWVGIIESIIFFIV